MADTWDRDLGRLGFTCPFPHGQFGREAFAAAGSKLEWQQWDVEARGARPECWLVQMSSGHCLARWKLEHQRMNRELCANRLMPWRPGARGISCTGSTRARTSRDSGKYLVLPRTLAGVSCRSLPSLLPSWRLQLAQITSQWLIAKSWWSFSVMPRRNLEKCMAHTLVSKPEARISSVISPSTPRSL